MNSIVSAETRSAATSSIDCQCPEHAGHVDPWLPYGGRGHQEHFQDIKKDKRQERQAQGFG